LRESLLFGESHVTLFEVLRIPSENGLNGGDFAWGVQLQVDDETFLLELVLHGERSGNTFNRTVGTLVDFVKDVFNFVETVESFHMYTNCVFTT